MRWWLSAASTAADARARDRAALQKLVLTLRTIIRSTSKQPPLLQTTTDTDEAPSNKTKRRSIPTVEQPRTEDSGKTLIKIIDGETKDNASFKDSSEVMTRKVKPKKKKRSVLANKSNPHHVNNCTYYCSTLAHGRSTIVDYNPTRRPIRTVS